MASEFESAPTQFNTSSAFLPTVIHSVCLHNWWLVKAEKDFHGKLLAVAGYPSRKQDAKRVFEASTCLRLKQD